MDRKTKVAVLSWLVPPNFAEILNEHTEEWRLCDVCSLLASFRTRVGHETTQSQRT